MRLLRAIRLAAQAVKFWFLMVWLWDRRFRTGSWNG